MEITGDYFLCLIFLLLIFHPYMHTYICTHPCIHIYPYLKKNAIRKWFSESIFHPNPSGLLPTLGGHHMSEQANYPLCNGPRKMASSAPGYPYILSPLNCQATKQKPAIVRFFGDYKVFLYLLLKNG